MIRRAVAALVVGFIALGCREKLSAKPTAVPRSRATPVATPASADASPPKAPRPPAGIREITWHVGTPFGPSDVVIAIPEEATPANRYPVLVAFHGRGESLKGPNRGPRGWVQDYALGTTVKRLHAPPLVPDDFLGFTTDERLDTLNHELAQKAYLGLIVVCPYLPDILHGAPGFEQGRLLADFVAADLLPRVYRETPAIGTARTTAVDGVSLGGRASLLVGLLRPEAFGSVGALQPALDNDEVDHFAALAKAARAKNPTLSVRLLTSDVDYFLEPTKELSRALTALGEPHTLDVVTGPHSYEFNQGPGGYEMLLFHDRALR
jgi:enterochelin esterase-like enzyme